MAITLTYGGTTLPLPNDLIWRDELAWSPVSQKTGRTIEGHLTIDRLVRVGGRPITLVGNERRSWVHRSTLLALQAWASLTVAQPVFILNLRGSEHVVIFDLDERGGGAVRGEPVFAYDELSPSDPYCSVELRFLTYEA